MGIGTQFNMEVAKMEECFFCEKEFKKICPECGGCSGCCECGDDNY